MASGRTAWAAVWALALAVVSLSTTENLPVSLLTPMAADLEVTAGAAGQTLTVSGAVACVTSLLAPWATRRVDRRTILLALTALQSVAALVTAFAPSLAVLLTARVLIGLSVGTFWALLPALSLRLARGTDVPRALSITFGGTALANIAAGPLASWFGGIIGWRGVYVAAFGIGVAALAGLASALHRMPSAGTARLGTLVEVARRPGVAAAMVGLILSFAGHRMLYTYLRPLLDKVAHDDLTLLSGILLAFGAAGFVGTSVAARFHSRNLRLTIAGASLAIAVLAGLLVPLRGLLAPAGVILVLWGFAWGLIPVGWSTWITRAVPDEAETAGGLQVGVIQVAVVAGAALGGFVVDRYSIVGVILCAGLIMLAAAGQVYWAVRPPQPTGGTRH